MLVINSPAAAVADLIALAQAIADAGGKSVLQDIAKEKKALEEKRAEAEKGMRLAEESAQTAVETAHKAEALMKKANDTMAEAQQLAAIVRASEQEARAKYIEATGILADANAKAGSISYDLGIREANVAEREKRAQTLMDEAKIMKEKHERAVANLRSQIA